MRSLVCGVATTKRKETNLSRFKRLSHPIWPGEFPIVWGAKYRYRVRQGKLKEEVELCVWDQTRPGNCKVQELNVQADHVHLIVQVPPKLAISGLHGAAEGQERDS